ncbi:hypothetical protein LTR37_011328 [Vermiconidia calcicola]|uniref:Uncharacterized protein n=1 Tax=Vermiconidia calcicola TaxID=1690605 RepID=A0ACC3N2P3_9PEZI|nr:hypothetical protein LTR37_011328 [Vermiconidia calcicola]
MASSAGGGFVLSPPPSSVHSSSTLSNSTLPHPRNSPLKPGGTKESAFIRYTDSQLLHIQRRFAKRTTSSYHGLSDEGREQADVWGDVKGYSSMKQACKEIEDLVGVVWVSGTPSLQIPYLLNLGMMLSSVVAAMPPSSKALFRCLGKLDHCFASLLQGRDVETDEALPGFEGMGRRGVSGTEKVRVRSLVERTRVAVMEAFKRGEFEEELPDESEDDEMELEGELVLEGNDGGGDEEEDSWDMQLARVYDRTVVELGDSLDQPDIGIITEGRGRATLKAAEGVNRIIKS